MKYKMCWYMNGFPMSTEQERKETARYLTRSRSTPNHKIKIYGSPRMEWANFEYTTRRYQIIRTKYDFPIVKWAYNAGEAKNMANKYRAVGYKVDVWMHTKDKAIKTNI